MTIVSVTIGVILVGSLLVPMASDVMSQLTEAGQTSWSALVGVVVTIVIISLVVVALYAVTSKK